MSTPQRLGLVVLAVAVLAVAFLALRPDDERADTPDAPAPPATTTRPGDATPTSPTPASPSVPLLMPGREPQTIEVSQGDRVTFRVRSPEAEEVHVHGYDIFRDLAPRETEKVSFTAELEGVFEIELERSGELLAELEVNP